MNLGGGHNSARNREGGVPSSKTQYIPQVKELYMLVCPQNLKHRRLGTKELEVAITPLLITPNDPLGKFGLPVLPGTQ